LKIPHKPSRHQDKRELDNGIECRDELPSEILQPVRIKLLKGIVDAYKVGALLVDRDPWMGDFTAD